MKVLVACEESQRVCTAFREKGHEAYSCDIIDCSGGHNEWHIKQDVLQLLNGSCTFKTCDGTEHTIDGKWDLLIAHPPCTYLTNGGAVRMYPSKGVIDAERFKKAMEAKKFFMSILNADCDRIAIENPIPMKCVELPKYSQIIQPYEHGEPFSKKTCLWLKGLEQLKPTKVLDEYQPFINGGGGRLNKSNYKDKKFAHGSTMRSKTFEGIAKAMAEQWG